MSAADHPQLPSGVRGLDEILGGGLPALQALLIAGLPGSGKTLLASQIAFHLASLGKPVLLATGTAEPHSRTLEPLRPLSFFATERLGKELFLLSAYPWLRQGAKDARDMLLGGVRERRAKVLVIDGLRAVREVWKDPVVAREFLAELSVGLSTHGCTGIFTLECAADEALVQPEAAVVDTLLGVSCRREGARRLRRIEVLKRRGHQPLVGEHAITLGPDGLEVIPRIESLTQTSGAPVQAGGTCAFGLPALDQVLGGGLGAGSLTVLSGQSGSGKTLLSASFAAEGARVDQTAVWLSFDEPVARVVDRARAVGLGFGAAVTDGAVRVIDPGSVDPDPDALLHAALRLAEPRGRLVIDGVGRLLGLLSPRERAESFLRALSFQVAQRGLCALLTFDAGFSDPAQAVSATPLVGAADNVLSVGTHHGGRQVWVHKLRDGQARADAVPLVWAGPSARAEVA